MQDNPFWQYSLSCYQQAEVEPLLLRLQEEVGADVNLLLCCAWLGQQQQSISADQLGHLQTCTARWRAECILPLRAVRQHLKDQPDWVDFREQVKALELTAESHQQAVIYQQSQVMLTLETDNRDPAAVMLANLQRYLMTLPGLEWQDVADTVIVLVNALTAD